MQITIIYAILILAIIFFISQELKKELTPNRYISNTYAYILLALIITALCVTVFDKQNIAINNQKLFASFILTVICISAIQLSSNVYIRHLAWLIFIACIAYIVMPAYQLSKDNNTFNNTILSLSIWLIILSYIATNTDINTFSTWGNTLLWLLLVLIISECISILFGTIDKSSAKLYGILTVCLFSAFVLYDTQNIIKKGLSINELCISKEQSTCANYPAESLSLFLDIINLFSGATMSQS